MSILLKTDIRGVGTAGQTVDIDAAQEADLVHRGAATYVQQKGLDVDPVVRAKVDLLTGEIKTIAVLTQAQYDALAVKDPNTEYNIVAA